jgi:type VI secretion system protein ImpG
MLNRYYQEELVFLRELGREFAREHPTLAPSLAEAGSDPDVERVLEGTAFLTGAVRRKIDDDLPEITQALLEMLWPHYLRPVPSTAIVEFAHPPKPKITGSERVPRGKTELESVPVDGTPCRFRTCYDLDVHPIRLADARLETTGRGALRLRFELLTGAKRDELRIDPLRLYLHGDLPVATTLYLWLVDRVSEGFVEIPSARGRASRAALAARSPLVRPVGFEEDQGLFPYPAHSFLGYRLLQEYFTLRAKFLFVDLHGLSALAAFENADVFEVVLAFRERPPEGLRVSTDSFRLHCAPVVNLFAKDGDPIRLDHRRVSYMLRPSDPEPHHFEVYSVDRVTGLATGSGRRRDYLPFHSFRHGMLAGDARAIYYKLTRRPAVGKQNSECWLSFVTAEERGVLPETEAISLELTCTNRRLPESLKPGDVSRHTDSSPQFVEFRNITPLTQSVLPPLEGGLHWRLISHLSLNYASLASPEALRGLLSLYNFQALYDRQAARANELLLEAIAKVDARRAERLFRGAPMRGIHTQVELVEDRFASEGELYLFASVLEEFLALYVTVNAFSQLTVRGAQQGEVYEWRPRVGKQPLI